MIKSLVSFILGAACLHAQVAKEANANYRDEQGRKQVASRLNDPGREARQRPMELLGAIGLKPGMSIADIGTGVGFMLPYMSRVVGPSGTVYAEDIFPDFLAQAKEHAKDLTNVRFVKGNERSASLPPNSIDRALILDAYHHFDYPKEMLTSIASALKPGGQIAIVEFEKNDHAMDGRSSVSHIRLTRDEFVKEVESFGFRASSVKEFTPGSQWVGLFEKR